MPRLVIRAMLADDLPAVCAVDRRCITPSWSMETFRGELKNTLGWYRVAEMDGAVVGYVGSYIIPDEAHITTLGVLPEARRRGTAERLLADVMQEALARGCRRVTLEVRESNEAAQALYRKYGFVPISRRKRYYTDVDEDAIVMWIDDMTRLGFRTLFAERVAALRAREE